jgi:DNA-binding transcriptional LysR family regulator
MDQNELDGLVALKLVVEKRNFTAAAEELGISPPAISKIIKHLEHRLGVALLSRTTRSTSLTEAGERFLNQAGPAIEQILVAIKGVGRYAEKPSGLLRINLPRATFHPYIEPLLISFAKKHPDVTVDLHFADHTEDVVESGFDAGIRYSDILAKDMVAVRISGPIRFIVVGSKKYLEKAGRPKLPKDLLSHNCLRLRFGNAGVYDRWEFENKGRDLQVQVKGSLIMNDPLLLVDAALGNLGLTYVVEDAVRDHLKSGKLDEVLSQFAPSSAGFYLYYPQRSQVQPKLRAFIEHVKDQSRDTLAIFN